MTTLINHTRYVMRYPAAIFYLAMLRHRIHLYFDDLLQKTEYHTGLNIKLENQRLKYGYDLINLLLFYKYSNYLGFAFPWGFTLLFKYRNIKI